MAPSETDGRRPLTEWLGHVSGWLGLLRAIGVTQVAFAIGNVVLRLQSTSPEAWRTPIVIRLVLFMLGGVGLVVGWAAARWILIVALGMFTIGMAGYVATHFEAWLFVLLLARVMTIVVLLHPGARRALARQTPEGAAPPAWVRAAMWVCIPLLMTGVLESMIKVALGVPVVP